MMHVRDTLSTVGNVQYRGGYLEYHGDVQYCGGYHEYFGVFSTTGNTILFDMITMGDIMIHVGIS